MRISKLCVCNNCNNLYIDTNPSDEQNFIDHFVNESLTCDHCCPVCLVDEYLQDVIDKKHYNCLKKGGVYYRIFDNQNLKYMHTGYNTRSKRELREHLVSYISIDTQYPRKYSLIDITSLWEFSIEESLTPFEEQD